MKQKNIPALISLLLAVLLIAACGRAQDSAGPTWREQYDLGMRYLSQGNYREAVIAFQAAIDIDPRSADAHVGLGQAYVGLGENQSAAGAFQTAIGIDSGFVDAYLGLAEAYVSLGDMEAALDALREGYEATNDERLLRRIEELQPSGGGAESGGAANGDSSGVPVRSPYGDIMPPELTVLTSIESWQYNVGWHGESCPYYVTMEYDQYGHIVRYESSSPGMQTSENGYIGASSEIQTWEYDETSGNWFRYKDGEKWENYWVPLGTIFNEWDLGYINAAPWPESESLSRMIMEGERMPDGRPLRVENQYYSGGEGWIYAIYEYDEYNNAVKITSYNDSGELGYCTFEWAVLILGPNVTYTMG